MTTPKTAAKRPATRNGSATRPASRTKTTQRPATPRAAKAPKKRSTTASGKQITITVPPLGEAAGRAVDAAAVPVETARRVLPAKGGLPLYAGLGALAVIGALEWPVAAGIGIGYALLRHNGLLAPPAAK
ncbi:hypothetical protein ABZ468_18295 [Streptomyces sp. NPDC005708]|uniref:hypothetical protein n=1 Tax=Streptomyces sp. NPDC005708 TaxID=3154564 RepID=UPI0033C23DAF